MGNITPQFVYVIKFVVLLVFAPSVAIGAEIIVLILINYDICFKRTVFRLGGVGSKDERDVNFTFNS